MGKRNKPPQHGDLLTTKESYVYAELFTEKSLKEIANGMGITVSAVKFHTDRIYKKFGVTRRYQLLVRRLNRERRNEYIGY